MGYIENHLPQNERIIAKARKSPVILMRELLVLLLCGGFIALFLLYFHWNMDKLIWVIIACAAVFLLFFLNSLFKIISLQLMVTANRFVSRENIIAVKAFETHLANIDGVEVKYNIFGRIFNMGNIEIITHSTRHTFKNIGRPDQFAALLNKQITTVAKMRKPKPVQVSFGLKPVSGTPSETVKTLRDDG